MDDQKKKALVTIFFSLLFLGTSCYFYFQKTETKNTEKEVVVKKKVTETLPKEDTVFVDIKGEVQKPGLYEVPLNQRVMDIINAAGGLTEQADTSTINLSKKVEDQMVIIVSKVGDSESTLVENDARISSNDALVSKSAQKGTGPISINGASKEELMSLNGIGEARANAIITYRNSHGGFKTIEELMEVKGIGESLFSKIKEHITL